MGGRGEETRFDLQCDLGVQSRAAIDCIQDACESVPFASVGGVDKRGAMTVPDYIPESQRGEYLGAYVAAAFRHYGPDWQTCAFGWTQRLTINARRALTEEE